MTKTILTTAATASLLAALAVAPAAQAHFDHARKYKRVYKPYVVRIDKHVRHFRKGYRNDCVQYKRRARLTGNAYWRYAAYHCVNDYHRPY